MIKQKLKAFDDEVIALYIHDVGNEIEKKTLEKNIELSTLMLYSLSHEIRTPINGMQGILQLLISKVYEKLHQQIKVALSCSEFLTSQINCILDYSQIIKNEFKIHLELVDIHKYLKHIKSIFIHNLISKDEKVKFKIIYLGIHIDYAIFDPQRTTQIICNLFNNATKYTNQGEIVLKFQINESHDIDISLIDTRCGLSSEQVDLLNNYEANLKLKNSCMNTSFPGYKLSIVQILLKEMNSKLFVSSRKGSGSSFSFKLDYSQVKEYRDIPLIKISRSKSCIKE